jgi:hypothetical protein
MRRILVSAVACLSFAAGALFVAGCAQQQNPSPAKNEKVAEKAPPDSKKKAEDEHGHKPGAHGGIIVEIGRDNYHAEAVFEKGGVLRLYILGKDEARVQEVENQDIAAFAKAKGADDSLEFALKPAPQNGDAAGKTSLFKGDLPKEVAGRKVEVTIPSIRINGERFRIGFASSTAEQHMESSLPPAAEGDAARALYLSPGGKYTQADIVANGKTTAGERYRNFISAHDAKPKPGEKVCPISQTKANPQVFWIIGGKRYEFCCAPCIDEFVQTAKEKPEEIKEPGDYVQK